MERSNLFKFIFILVIGVMVLVVSLYSFFGGKKDEENIEDMFKTEDSEDQFDLDDYDLDFDVAEDNENDSDGDEPKDTSDDGEEVEDVGFEDDVEVDDEFNYEQIYIDLYGEDELDRTLEVAEDAMTLYLEKGKNFKSIEDDFTSSYFNTFKKEVNDSKGSTIESLEIFPTEQINKGEIIIGCIANYDDKVELFNVVFVEDDVFLIDNIVSMWGN